METSNEKAASCGSLHKRIQENLTELSACTSITQDLLEYLTLDKLISRRDQEDLSDTTITSQERVLRLYTEIPERWDDSGFEKFSKALFLGGNKMAYHILTQKSEIENACSSNNVRDLEKNITTVLNPLCPTSKVGIITTNYHSGEEMSKKNNKTCKDLEVNVNKLGLLYSVQTESEDGVPPLITQPEKTLPDLDLAVMLNNLGVLCAQDGKCDDAVGLYREALRIQGDAVEDQSGMMIRSNISSLKHLGRCKDAGKVHPKVKSNKPTHWDRREKQVNKGKSHLNGKHEIKIPHKRNRAENVFSFVLSLLD